MAKPPAIKNTEGPQEDWLTTYADSITLLMCFFVVMFSMSEPNTEKFEAVSKNIVETLSKKDVKRHSVTCARTSATWRRMPGSGAR